MARLANDSFIAAPVGIAKLLAKWFSKTSIFIGLKIGNGSALREVPTSWRRKMERSIAKKPT